MDYLEKPEISFRRNKRNHILITMKLTFVFLLIGMLSVHAEISSQVYSVSLKNAKLRDVVRNIEDQSDYRFFFSDDVAEFNKPVEVNVSNVTIDQLLNKILTPHDLGYKILENNLIVISPYENTSPQQENKPATGIVLDNLGEPIIGASIIIKGTTTGTITDIDGKFSIAVPDNAILVFSYIGYLPQEIAVKNTQTPLNIIMREDSKELEEVVVVGYGVQKKASVTGSVASVTNQDLVKAPVSNISNAIAGRLPGIRVQNSGGIPGAESTVDIRGFGSPLILVDGIEQPGFQIDPNEIESISVLKDAAAAIYGVKAGNGVLLITTKKGVKGKPKITYNGSVGVQNFTSYPKMVNAAQYAELTDEDAINRGNPPVYGPEKLQKFKEGIEDGYKSYDWADILTRNNAPQTQHNLNISGGSEDVSYFTSVGYLNQEGIYATKDLGFSRYNFRSNLSATIAKNFTAEVQMSGRIENRKAPYDDDDYIIFGITRMHPTMSPYANDDDHSYYGLTNFQNPLARSDADVSGYKRSKKKLFHGQFSLKYDAPFLPGLSAKVLFSYLTKVEEEKDFGKEFFLYSYDKTGDSYAYNKVFTGNSPSSLRRKTYTSEQNFLQFSVNYNRTFAQKHNVSAVFLYEQREDLDDFVEAYRQFDIDALDQINAGSDTNKNNKGTQTELANVSFVGRVNYDYAGKYLMELAFREDGSAKFYKDNRWGFFPSVSAGWRISEEAFIKDRTSILDNLKLRLSYGKMGDDKGEEKDNDDSKKVKAFQYLTGYKYPGDYSYILGSNVIKSLDSKGLPNLAYTWFTSEIYNTGVDVSLWNRLLEASVDVFYRKRKGLLAYRYLSLPNTFGSSLPQENLNSDNYRGFEITLGHTNQIQDFRYSVKGNLSFTRIKNIYIEQADPVNSYLYWKDYRSDRWQNLEYGYKCVGQFRNQDEINNWAVQDGTGNTTLSPGDLKYEDFNGDGVINDYDIQPIGRSDKPEIYFGLDLSANWKGFDLSILMQGATNYARYMDGAMGYALFNGSGSLDAFMNRWHRADLYDTNSEWISGKYPSTYSSGKTSNVRRSTFNLIDSYYLRIKNIELGYTFPRRIMQSYGISDLRVYISGNNVLTFDNLPFSDPEAPSSDRILYPQLRIWNIGVNLTF